MTTTRHPPKPGYVDIRDPRTGRLVCRYNPTSGEVEVAQRGGDVRRGTLPIDGARVAQYVKLAQGVQDE